MDRGIVIGVGISVASVAIPYAIKAVPTYIAWPGIAIGLAIAGYAALPEASRPPLASSIAYLVGLTALAIGYGYQQAYVKPKAIAAVEPLNGTVDIRCEQTQIPRVVPPNGGYNVIPLFFNNSEIQLSIARMTFQQAPGTALDYGDQNPRWATLCRITNYGDKPLYGVKLPVDVTVHESVQDPNNPKNLTARTNGPAIWSGKREIIINKLDAGMDRVFEFYIQGLDKFVGITFGDHFKARPFTGDRERTIAFVKPNSPLDLSMMVMPSNPEPASRSAAIPNK